MSRNDLQDVQEHHISLEQIETWKCCKVVLEKIMQQQSFSVKSSDGEIIFPLKNPV